MAFLYVTEFENLAWVGPNAIHSVPAGAVPPLAAYQVAIGSSTAKGGTLNPATKFVLLNSDVACSVGFGADAVVTTNRLPANADRYYGVNGAGGGYISVIANS